MTKKNIRQWSINLDPVTVTNKQSASETHS